jgi:preprotein translocase subunit SecA
LARFDLEDLIYINQEAKWRAIARTVKELNKNGQPVLIGTVSIEKNELLSAFLKQEGVPHQVLNAKNHENEGEIIAMGGIKGAVTVATNMAGRGVDIKLGGPKATKEEADEIRALGGLYVIGTERHEARRIDNQLRGRSGRQGDPGVSQFYVALDDDLMRIFGGDKMQGMMTSMNFPVDEAIQNSFISKNIERAQDQIEGQHFDARKHTLSYDDILAKHRTGIYKRRRALLMRESEVIDSLQQEIVTTNPDLATPLVSKKEQLGDDVYTNIFVSVALQTLDRLWMEHLEIMDQSRRSVGLRAYGQREPLVEYAKEGFRLYKELEQAFLFDVASFVSRVDVGEVRNEIARLSQQVEVTAIDDNAQAPKSDPSTGSGIGSVVELVETTGKDTVTLSKDGETKIVKRKKMQSWTDAGWIEIK